MPKDVLRAIPVPEGGAIRIDPDALVQGLGSALMKAKQQDTAHPLVGVLRAEVDVMKTDSVPILKQMIALGSRLGQAPGVSALSDASPEDRLSAIDLRSGNTISDDHIFAQGTAVAHAIVRHGCPDYRPMPGKAFAPQATEALVQAVEQGQASVGDVASTADVLVASLLPPLMAEAELYDFLVFMAKDSGAPYHPLAMAGAGLVAVMVGQDILAQSAG